MGANLKLKGEVEKRKEKTKKPPMKLVGHAANFSDPRRSCLINSGKTNRDETLFFCLFNIFFFFFSENTATHAMTPAATFSALPNLLK